MQEAPTDNIIFVRVLTYFLVMIRAKNSQPPTHGISRRGGAETDVLPNISTKFSGEVIHSVYNLFFKKTKQWIAFFLL